MWLVMNMLAHISFAPFRSRTAQTAETALLVLLICMSVCALRNVLSLEANQALANYQVVADA